MRLKRILIFVIVLFSLCFALPVAANTNEDFNSIYEQQFDASGMNDLGEVLPEEVQDKMNELDISSADIEWSELLSFDNVFELILDFLKSGAKTPLKVACLILAVLLFGAAFGAMSSSNISLKYVIALGVCAVAVVPVSSVVESCTEAIKSIGVFMSAFVPIFAAMLVAGGRTVTATGFSSVMLLISEGVAALCSFLLVPVTSVQLSLGISGSVSNGINTSSLNNAIKKATNWVLAVSSTVLLSVLSLQTIVSIPQDNIASKTAKFIIGSTVPVVGNTVSEAISTVRGCLKLLSASSVVYGVIAIALIVLPVIIELILWRGCMLLCSTVSEMLNFDKICALLKAIDNVLSFILGITILISVLFVISLTVISVL